MTLDELEQEALNALAKEKEDDANDTIDDDNNDNNSPDDESGLEPGSDEHEVEDGNDNDEDEHESGDDDIIDDNTSDPLLTVKENGLDIALDTPEEVQAYIAKVKSSNKPKYDHLIESGTLSEEDLQLLLDAKAGNVGAIKKLAGDVDLIEVEEFDGEYKPQAHLPQAKANTGFDEVITYIDGQEGLTDKVNALTDNLPSDFKDAILASPQALRSFADQVNGGVAQELLPEAYKASLTNGGTLLDNYVRLGQERYSNNNNPEQKSTSTRQVSAAEKALREKAGSTKTSSESVPDTISGLGVDGIWDKPLDELLEMDFQ
jgi:hypothetical protein